MLACDCRTRSSRSLDMRKAPRPARHEMDSMEGQPLGGQVSFRAPCRRHVRGKCSWETRIAGATPTGRSRPFRTHDRSFRGGIRFPGLGLSPLQWPDAQRRGGASCAGGLYVDREDERSEALLHNVLCASGPCRSALASSPPPNSNRIDFQSRLQAIPLASFRDRVQHWDGPP